MPDSKRIYFVYPNQCGMSASDLVPVSSLTTPFIYLQINLQIVSELKFLIKTNVYLRLTLN